MRRGLMAIVLLTGIVNLSRADYLVLRIALDPPAPPMPMGMGAKAPAPPVPVMKPGEYVLAVINVNRVRVKIDTFGPGALVPMIDHKWGRSAAFELLADGREISMQFVDSKAGKKSSKSDAEPIFFKSPTQLYSERTAKKETTADGQLALAAWCLQIGMPDKCQEQMDELEKIAAADPGAPARVATALAAYKQIKPILNDRIAKRDKAESWKVKLSYAGLASKTHYALVHDSQDPVRDGVDRLLVDLENNFKSFYLFFAIKGKALPAPREQLTAILAGDMTVFQKFVRGFEVPERLTDGCHIRQENLVVFAPERLDKASQRFSQQMKTINTTFAGVDLLHAKFRQLAKLPRDPKDKDFGPTLDANNAKVLQDGRAHLFALMEAALRDEAEIAVATHEGTRQLIVETGLLPGNIAVPEVLRYGLASLFEMPKGPLQFKNDTLVKFPFWTGADGPHWAWRRYLDELIRDKLISDTPTDALVGVLTGKWTEMARLRRATPKGEDGKEPEDAAEEELATGRCLAWALHYYLLNERFDEYMAFLGEISNLPRDIELDEHTFLMIFCKAFRIDTTGLLPGKLDGNAEAYADMAKAWLAAMRKAPALSPPPIKWLEQPKPVDPNAPPTTN